MHTILGKLNLLCAAAARRRDVILLSAALTLSSTCIAQTADTQKPRRPDLTGTVTSVDGEPLRGATVYVYTAKPKVGPGYL